MNFRTMTPSEILRWTQYWDDPVFVRMRDSLLDYISYLEKEVNIVKDDWQADNRALEEMERDYESLCWSYEFLDREYENLKSDYFLLRDEHQRLKRDLEIRKRCKHDPRFKANDVDLVDTYDGIMTLEVERQQNSF